MLKLGIIGSENSHSFKIATLCNVEKRIPIEVTHLWGETEESARQSAEKGSIPRIVVDWREMLGQVDGIMIDHRNGDRHEEPAEYFISKGVPTFVDKPMTCRLSSSRRLLELGCRHSVPVLTFSAKPIQKAFKEFAARVEAAGSARAVHSCGPANIQSPHGGIFFYGIHQVDAIVEMMGCKATEVACHRSGRNAVGVILFSGGRSATVQLIEEGSPRFHWTAHLTDGESLTHADLSDADPYLSSGELIYGLLSKGEVPFSAERMLAPIAILEAFSRALASGKPERVEAI